MTAISIKNGSIVYALGTSDAEIEAAARIATRRRKIQVLIWRLVVLVVLLGSWEISARREWIDPFFYSYPSEILARLWEFILEGSDGVSIWVHLYYTLTAALMGFFLGSLIGIVCGIALGRNRLLSDIFSIYIKVLNAIPRVVLAPIFILILGFGLASKVAVSFVMVFFIVFANAFQGVREADRAMIANAQILGASNWQVTRSVIIPSAMSWIFASLHLSFSFAIVGAIVGEFIGSNKGIGHVIQLARGLHDVALMFAAIIVVLVVVLLAEYLMTLVEHRLAKWRPPAASDGHV
jgi:NitT/TauT family transport system permease protein